ncbi:hypothetical protein JQ616_13850 [Bradyrhizobium tropiciagri]|uniref:hypothetical protein n=1 Tax=Bradyrhizobium tropiciagri TaxID=312253 RepID=UPI001BAE380C|nr:hypothetical protein [Bradyrhizobium tropiciagri]MBR0896038.1 hypothetical protein [Bradyrhizobium tropiciagri]
MVVSAVVAMDVASTAVAASVVVVAAVNKAADENLDRIDIGNSILRFGDTGMARSQIGRGLMEVGSRRKSRFGDRHTTT